MLLLFNMCKQAHIFQIDWEGQKGAIFKDKHPPCHLNPLIQRKCCLLSAVKSVCLTSSSVAAAGEVTGDCMGRRVSNAKKNGHQGINPPNKTVLIFYGDSGEFS